MSTQGSEYGRLYSSVVLVIMEHFQAITFRLISRRVFVVFRLKAYRYFRLHQVGGSITIVRISKLGKSYF
jgi:hypothetical protein